METPWRIVPQCGVPKVHGMIFHVMLQHVDTVNLRGLLIFK